MIKPWHIIVLAVVLILLFGAKRLPDMARSVGRSLRIIKAETRGLADDNESKTDPATPTTRPLTTYSDDETSPLDDAVRDPVSGLVLDRTRDR